MKKALLTAVLIGMGIATTAYAFQPHTGHWYDSTAPGRGFNFDIQNGVLVMTAYSYDASGNAVWYLSAGPMSNSQHSYVGTLDKYAGGQCVTCAYRAATPIGNDGTVSITFTDETTATITFPGGAKSVIHPFDFGYGTPPNGLLGEWVFVYDILTTWADRFDYTTTAAGTSDGTGIVLDVPRRAGCELQVRGVSAGFVLCVDLDTSNNPQNLYKFRYGGIDETFNGQWVSPTSGNVYAMKGFRVVSPSGYSKAAVKSGVGDDTNAALKAAQDSAAPVEKASPEFMREFQQLAERIRQQQRQ